MATQLQASALVLFSGGQDSATCLAWALERYECVETIGFSYGQRHVVELAARLNLRQALMGYRSEWAERLGEDVLVDISGYGALAESALTREVEFEINEQGLPSSFVPGRNLVFLTLAGAHAWRRGVPTLVGGMCQTDYSGYPDCREDTIQAQADALSLGLGRPFEVITPLMHLTKAETWSLADELGGEGLIALICEHSHTCYRGNRELRHDWGYGCGNCPACELRMQGWNSWQQARSGQAL